MDYDYLHKLKQHPTWRLLTADYAPLIISFFYHTFIKLGAQSYVQSELTAKLDDYLFHLRQAGQDNNYLRSAQEYLDDWAHNDNAWLRKYYPEKGDEPQFDLTSASEKAIEWLRGLEQKAFIGTESRLLTIFQLLRDVIYATETDPETRMAELEKQKAQIDAEISHLRQGKIDPYDPTQVKERYYEIVDAVRRLLADFRQVEENFRQLDRRTREKIATSGKSKGVLLDEIFGEEDTISSSDQGRSFRAFWEFLMLPARQEELEELIERLLRLKETQALEADDLLPRFKYRLMEAGDKVRKTSSSLVEHLRRFLDDQALFENKRIMNIIQAIEKWAIENRQNPPKETDFASLDDVHPAIDLPLARGLYVFSNNPQIEEIEILEGKAGFSADALYQIHYVDEEELKLRIRKMLQENHQTTLAEICSRFPLEKGLSDLLTYLNLACRDSSADIDDQVRDIFLWEDKHGCLKKALVPRIIFTREVAS